MTERTYTTHEIAKFCDAAPSSVVNWISSGRIKSYVTPGGHHRVTREDLLVFLAEFRFPIPKELAAHPMRVLIVDDDAEVALMIQRTFVRGGGTFETEVCHNGMEALIRIGQAPPDLIVLDIILPKMDGIQVCRVLKSKAPTRDIKIVAITGKKISAADKKRLEEVKVDALFRKPLDVVALLSKCTELLGQSAAFTGGR
jgi:excisionase family DNA binding protein